MAKKNFSNDLLRDLHSEPLNTLVEMEEQATELSELSVTEQETLDSYEKIIETGLKTFIEVGNALYQIKSNKLYRSGFTTFEAYCKDRWQLKRQRAYELMNAAEVVVQLAETNLSEISDKNISLPSKESHANALAQIPTTLRFQVWRAVVEESLNENKPITAKMILEQIDNFKNIPNTKLPVGEDPNTEILKRMREKVAKAKLDDVRIEISGKWLIKNKLVEIWREIRQNPNEEIGEGYSFQITLSQAEKMGIIRRI
jgi:hypothetical protein